VFYNILFYFLQRQKQETFF